jgi:hypothetical protein
MDDVDDDWKVDYIEDKYDFERNKYVGEWETVQQKQKKKYVQCH